MKTKEAKKIQSLEKEVRKEEKKKSKTTLFWEKYPNGIGGEIVNIRAVLR